MMGNLEEEILSVDEAAEILRICRNSMYDLLRKGEIKGAFKIKKVWKIPRRSIWNYIDK